MRTACPDPWRRRPQCGTGRARPESEARCLPQACPKPACTIFRGPSHVAALPAGPAAFGRRRGIAGALLAATALGLLALSGGAALAQPEKCPRMVAERPKVRLAALDAAMLRLAEAAGPVSLTFVGHASFLIESPAG